VEIYEIGRNNGRTQLLVFQSQHIRGARTKEATAAFEMLKESFSVTPK
jgi:hypothetical protein